MSRPIQAEITAVRRRHHDNRGRASVEHLTADSRTWIAVLGADFGRVMASLTPIGDLDQDPGDDPREALLALCADAQAWIDAMDERPGTGVQTGILDRYGAGGRR